MVSIFRYLRAEPLLAGLLPPLPLSTPKLKPPHFGIKPQRYIFFLIYARVRGLFLQYPAKKDIKTCIQRKKAVPLPQENKEHAVLKPTKQQEYGNSTYGNIADAVGGHLVQSEKQEGGAIHRDRQTDGLLPCGGKSIRPCICRQNTQSGEEQKTRC